MNLEERLYSRTLGSKMGITLKAIVKKMDKHFLRHNLELTVEQMFLLIILNEENGLIQQDIAEIMSKDKSAVFRQIDSLEKKHFVARMESPDDKRKKVLMLTKEGLRILKEAEKLQAEVMSEITHQIQPRELEIFENVLQKIYGNATRI